MTVILKLRYRSQKMEIRQRNCANTMSAFNGFLQTQPLERIPHFTLINMYRICKPPTFKTENYGFTR